MLNVLTRDDAPPLTDKAAWEQFPWAAYDVVIIDSLDSSSEGVGEQDSAKPSRALASILDIARKDGGPAILVLGNTVKSATHSRGSGVVEDRADIVYEVRDMTEFAPSGRRPWWEELPPAGAGDWQGRATRRRRRDRYRLAFVPTKFRLAEEPDPFILEVNLSGDLWTLRDATDDVDAAGAEARVERERNGIAALQTAIREAKEPRLSDRDGVPILQACGMTRAEARRLIAAKNGIAWAIRQGAGPGRPHILESVGGKAEIGGSENLTDFGGSGAGIPADRMDIGGRNSTPSEGPSGAGFRGPSISAASPRNYHIGPSSSPCERCGRRHADHL